MGTAREFQAEKLVIPVLISCPEHKEALLNKLTAAFGPRDFLSEDLDFDFSSYYDREMGKRIRRCFVSVRDLIDPGSFLS